MNLLIRKVLGVATLFYGAKAFTPTTRNRLSAKSFLSAISLSAAQCLDKSFTPPDISGIGGITEKACDDAAMRLNRVNVPVPEYICSDGEVGISFIHWEAEKKTNTLPIILVHGFDSSCLEYRRLGPKLAALGIETYAVDLLGWGFSQLKSVNTFSAQAKVDALAGFWKVIGGGKPVCVAGASLGGAAAIEYAAAYPDVVKACVFIDAQGFVDGVGPMAQLPNFLAEAGVQVLKSVPLRSMANEMSYFDTEKYATDDALKVGRLHCLQDGWSDALVSFMLSGGFAPSSKIANIESPSLVLWGRQDGILEIEFAEKFINTLPNAELRWIEECGHVPHLEQSEMTAKEIAQFLSSDKCASILSLEGTDAPNYSTVLLAGSLGAVGVAAAALIGSV